MCKWTKLTKSRLTNVWDVPELHRVRLVTYVPRSVTRPSFLIIERSHSTSCYTVAPISTRGKPQQSESGSLERAVTPLPRPRSGPSKLVCPRTLQHASEPVAGRGADPPSTAGQVRGEVETSSNSTAPPASSQPATRTTSIPRVRIFVPTPFGGGCTVDTTIVQERVHRRIEATRGRTGPRPYVSKPTGILLHRQGHRHGNETDGGADIAC